MKFTPKIRELLSEVAHMPWELKGRCIRLDVGFPGHTYWNVCPVCAVANVRAGDVNYFCGAFGANSEMGLGLSEDEVRCIIEAADFKNDPNRKELMKILGMKGK